MNCRHSRGLVQLLKRMAAPCCATAAKLGRAPCDAHHAHLCITASTLTGTAQLPAYLNVVAVPSQDSPALLIHTATASAANRRVNAFTGLLPWMQAAAR
jgi:hypothetical protein